MTRLRPLWLVWAWLVATPLYAFDTPYNLHDNSTWRLQQGNFSALIQRPAEAVAYYRNALALTRPHEVEIKATLYYNLAQAYAKLAHWPRAIASHQQALLLDTTLEPAYIGLVHAWDGAGALDDAETDLLHAVALDGENWQAWYLLGMIAYHNNELETARAAFGRVSTLSPGSPLVQGGVAKVVLGSKAATLSPAEPPCLPLKR